MATEEAPEVSVTRPVWVAVAVADPVRLLLDVSKAPEDPVVDAPSVLGRVADDVVEGEFGPPVEDNEVDNGITGGILGANPVKY